MTYIHVAMFVESREALIRSFDVFSGNVPDLLRFQDANEPPVAVAIVHEKQAVPLGDICLSFDGCDECVERIDEIKVDGGIWDFRDRAAVVFIHKLFMVVLVFHYRDAILELVVTRIAPVIVLLVSLLFRCKVITQVECVLYEC